MAIPGHLVQTQIGKRGVELNVARKKLVRRSHQRIADVITNAGKGAETNELSPTDLHLITTDSDEVGMAPRQSHLWPGSQYRSDLAVAARDVGLVGFIVVEEIELDKFDALQLQLIERGVDPMCVGADHLGVGQKPRRRQRRGIAGSPITRPIQPGPFPETFGAAPPETSSSALRHLTKESLLSGRRHHLDISLQNHLCTTFCGVREDTERTVPRTPSENTESRGHHNPCPYTSSPHRHPFSTIGAIARRSTASEPCPTSLSPLMSIRP